MFGPSDYPLTQVCFEGGVICVFEWCRQSVILWWSASSGADLMLTQERKTCIVLRCRYHVAWTYERQYLADDAINIRRLERSQAEA